jgi:plastocyanin
MYKKLLVGLVVFSLLTAFLAACSIRDESGTGGPSVHMSGASFVQTSITIPKGSSLTLVDDVAVEHIIKNGTWNGSTPQPKTESGAPAVNLTFNGNDSAPMGPFNTAGTFQFYCTIHPGMNLTVTVQ